MIAKHIQNSAPSDSFKRLAAYVTGERNGGRGDPTGWALSDYIIDKHHNGEKVAAIRVTNCLSEDPGWATKECVVLAAQNTRSKSDRSYHLLVSFPEGERPTPEQMIDIEDEIVRSIGLQDHKRISAIHQNTKNWHLHVAICTVHPMTLRNVTPFFDHLRLSETCQTLELKHCLERDNHTKTPERPLNGTAGALKAHADRVAFAVWIEEHAGPDIERAGTAAKTWDDLHAALAPHGLVIKPRGAGLVIAHHANHKIRIKASDISRTLSMKALTGRLGTYQPPSAEPTPEQAYASSTIEPTAETEALWTKYQAERAAAADAMTVSSAALRVAHAKYADDLRVWYSQRYEVAYAQRLSGADRRNTLRTLAEQRRADQVERRAREKRQREELKAQHTAPTWSGFLAREAARGGKAAVGAQIERSLSRDDERNSGLGLGR